ncbi:C2H2 zinc finger [Ceratobasidium sp. AG-Ba]|nr:C2H2 zinc finger [Ceratobasidium sp. AG-Ba]
MNGWPGHAHLGSPIPLTVRTACEHPDEWADHDPLGARRLRECASSGDDSPISPRYLDDDNANRPIGNGLLLSPDGRIVRHVDSFVRSTRHRGRGERADEPIDDSDEEGSPRSRRLTFEFRNFNLYPDTRDGEQAVAVQEKRRPSRSLDIERLDEEPTYASYLPPTSYVTSTPQHAPYYGYNTRHMPPLSPLLPPLPSIHARSPDPAPPMVAGPSFGQGSPPTYRSIHSVRPAGSRSKSDVGLSQRPTFLNGEKRGASARETTRGDEDDEGSSELSEPEDADGPSKSGDSSVTSGTRQRRKPSRARKKKPYKSRRCDICNKTFTKECDVTRHRRTAHGEDEIEFKCHECGRSFNRKDALERHYKVYEGTPHVARRYQPKTYLGQNKK